ncbi:MAG TPA: hypothetical protein VEL31_26130, partial [Ktedonobacteraceae bacterium]|nr:hypothetical protein [Ktedonobacteraceae bacterium]
DTLHCHAGPAQLGAMLLHDCSIGHGRMPGTPHGLGWHTSAETLSSRSARYPSVFLPPRAGHQAICSTHASAQPILWEGSL